MRKAVRVLATGLLLGLFVGATGLAQGLSSLERLLALGLPRIEAALTLYHSSAATDEARILAGELASALAWYRARLDWATPLTVAVLDAADYPRVTAVPYPTPLTETRTGLIILADRLEAHPGFDLWDLESRPLNAAFALHEVGHVVARDHGIASANAWIGELVANVVMAAYVRAERPQFAGFQSGLPPRFTAPGRYRRLTELDAVYFAMGQQEYLWFQFQIAGIADRIAAAGDIRTVVEGFRREFPGGRGRESTAATFARLERIAPGVTTFAATLPLQP